MALFPAELSTRLRGLAFQARRLGGLTTSPSAAPPPGSPEQTRYRDYAPGDDLRQVDWPICARHDELVVKLLPRCGNQFFYVLLDASASMTAGTPPKFDLARWSTAALAYVALTETAQVGVVVFADRILVRRPILGDRARLPGLLGFLETLSPYQAGTDLARVAEAFVGRQPRRGPTVVLSDFYDPQGFQTGMEILRRGGCQPRMVRFYDRSEGEPDLLGDAEVWDIESNRRWQGIVTKREIQRYRRLFQEHRQALRDYAARYSLRLAEIPCDLPREQVLRKALGLER